jgi:tRNA(Ile)-lysidine synthase TilS/MesJ
MKHLKKLTPEEYLESKQLIEKLDKRVKIPIPVFMAAYNRITGRKEKGTNCSSCYKKRYQLLKLLCEAYEKANPVKVEAPVVDPPKKKRGRPAKNKQNEE